MKAAPEKRPKKEDLAKALRQNLRRRRGLNVSEEKTSMADSLADSPEKPSEKHKKNI